MEADLQRYYSTDLRDLWRGNLTLRRVGVLIAGLPSDSLTMSILAPELPDEPSGSERGWSTEAHLLATVVDAIQVTTHAVIQSNSTNRIPPPQPLPRPGERVTSRRLTPEELDESYRRRFGGDPDGI